MNTPARGIVTTPVKTDPATIQALGACPLFTRLAQDEIKEISREFIRRNVGRLELTGSEQDELRSSIIIVEAGTVESVHVPVEDPSRASYFETLSPGSIWGTGQIVKGGITGEWPFRLRSAGSFTCLTTGPVTFARLCDEWPQLQTALTVYLLQRETMLAASLADARAKAADITTVLDRVESVAGMLLMSSTENAQDVVQRRWLLKHSPASTHLRGAQEAMIEQGYLASRSDYEDRIRSKGDQYFRTQKFGSGQSRRTYEREISKAEYEELLRKVRGHLIRKIRWTLNMEGAASLCIDVFKGALQGLVMAEADFKDETQAISFRLPDWLEDTKEVTKDKSYGNAALAQNGAPQK